MEKTTVIPPGWRRFLPVVLLGASVALGCAAKVQKGAYQVGTEALALSAQTGSYEELETALRTIDAELEQNPADVQLLLLRAVALLRQIRQRSDEAEIWRLKSPQTVQTVQRAIQLAEGSSNLPDWIAPRAWIVAGDLLVTRAQSPSANSQELATKLWRISLAEAASHFYGHAHQLVEALGRNPSGVALRQRSEALQGWYAARLLVAGDWFDLGLRTWTGPSLDDLWNAKAAGDGIPKDFQVQNGVAVFDPALHRQLAQHAALAQRLTKSQRDGLVRAFEAFRGETLALFFENPGEVAIPARRFLNELGAELSASAAVWKIDSEPPPSVAGVRLFFAPPKGLWEPFSPPIRELTVQLGKAVERLDAPTTLGSGETTALRVSPEGLWLELRPGPSICIEPTGAGTCRRAARELKSKEILAALAGPGVIEVEDGFGNRQAAAVPGSASSPSRDEIEDRLEDFQTHIRRRGFDRSEARRMLWRVAELCARTSGLDRHRCRLLVVRGFAQLAPPGQRLHEPVRQLLRDLHALALALENPAQRAEAMLAEVEFDLDFGLAGEPDLPASTRSKIDLVRQALTQLPPESADTFAYRLNALEAELR